MSWHREYSVAVTTVQRAQSATRSLQGRGGVYETIWIPNKEGISYGICDSAMGTVQLLPGVSNARSSRDATSSRCIRCQSGESAESLRMGDDRPRSAWVERRRTTARTRRILGPSINHLHSFVVSNWTRQACCG